MPPAPAAAPAPTPAAAARGGVAPHAGPRRLPKTGRRVAVFAAVVLLGLGGVFLLVRHHHQSQQQDQAGELNDALDRPTDVDVVRVRRASAARVLSLPGEVRPFYETTLFARVSGYLSEWTHDMGDHVEENGTLATIDTPELDAQLVESKAKVDALRADVRVAESAANFAKVSFDRVDSASDGAVSKQERDEKKAGLDSAEAKLTSAQAQLSLGQADVQRLESMEKFKTVRRPVQGDDHAAAHRHRGPHHGRQHRQHHATIQYRAVR